MTRTAAKPAVRAYIPGPPLCAMCGRFHGDSECEPWLLEEPDGLFDGDDELTPLGRVVEDAANYLAMRGYLDPEDDGYPDWLLAELVAVAGQGSCGELCPHPLDGSRLADHFLAGKQEQWETSIPVWACDCGTGYKILAEMGSTEDFYEIRADGMLGDQAGHIRYDSRGRYKASYDHTGERRLSDKCKSCGREFAAIVAARAAGAVPHQMTFGEDD